MFLNLDVDQLTYYLAILVAVFSALTAALWLSLIIWSFRDMRARSRDPFAQILAAIVVGVLPIFGLVIYLILRPTQTLAESYERALEEEALLQEIEERPVCPGCSRIVQDKWMACPYCHTHLKRGCHQCHQLIELQWTLCPFCATAQAGPVETAVSDHRSEAGYAVADYDQPTVWHRGEQRAAEADYEDAPTMPVQPVATATREDESR